MTMSDKRFDRRLIERNLRNGVLTRDEYQKHLDGLPDRTESMIRLGDVESVDDDDVLENVDDEEDEEEAAVEGDDDEDVEDEEDDDDEEDEEEEDDDD